VVPSQTSPHLHEVVVPSQTSPHLQFRAANQSSNSACFTHMPGQPKHGVQVMCNVYMVYLVTLTTQAARAQHEASQAQTGKTSTEPWPCTQTQSHLDSQRQQQRSGRSNSVTHRERPTALSETCSAVRHQTHWLRSPLHLLLLTPAEGHLPPPHSLQGGPRCPGAGAVCSCTASHPADSSAQRTALTLARRQVPGRLHGAGCPQRIRQQWTLSVTCLTC